ncbi:MAG: hypothetical protein IPH31_00285 [Lewinellaceae bacterium]|nr:hypothetical protein [Lewinellaceae bacterium]
MCANTDGIDNQRDMLSNLEALFQAEAANRLNTVMRLLTVISTIFIPLTFIVGIYGMNFDYLPELHWHYGYFIVLGIMFCLMIGMLIYFRKNDGFRKLESNDSILKIDPIENQANQTSSKNIFTMILNFTRFLFLLAATPVIAQEPLKEALAPCGTRGVSDWLREYRMRPPVLDRSEDTLWVALKPHLLAKDNSTGRIATEKFLNSFCHT